MNNQDVIKICNAISECIEKDNIVMPVKESDGNEIIKGMKVAISALEKQINNGWILVSERLPESVGETILISVAINRGISHFRGSIDIAYLRNDKERVFYGMDGKYSFDEVKAWQPLPQPYTEVAK